MWPVLLDFGNFKLYSFGFMMGLGFFVSIFWSIHRAKRYRISSDFVSNLAIVIVAAGIIGARLTFFIVEGRESEIFSMQFLQVWQGGMVFYGGFVAAFIAGLAFTFWNRVPWKVMADVACIPVAAGHALGRLGCFLAGCCFGKPCELPWAVTFTHPESLAPLNVHLHPTQLYEAVGNLGIVFVLLAFERKKKNLKAFQTFSLYLALYAFVRIIVESLRGDEVRGFFDFWGLYPNAWLSTSTLIGILMLAAAAVGWIYAKRSPIKA